MDLIIARSLVPLSLALVASTLTFTQPNSPLRPIPIVCLIINVYNALTLPQFFGPNAIAGAILGNGLLLWLLRAIEILYIRGYFEPNEQTTDARQSRPTQTPVPRFLRSLELVYLNLREIGTSHPVPCIPPFSSTDPTYVPSPALFLARKAATTTLAYLALDYFTSQPPPPAALIAPGREEFFSRLGSLTLSELIFRAGITVIFWLCNYLVLQILHGLLALICVGSGFWAPADFPPMFGSVANLAGIRAFWGVFWHQILRKPLTSCAGVVRDLLVPLSISGDDAFGKLLRRYAHVLAVFALSGASHVVGAVAEGTGWSAWKGTMWFFCMNALGIMLEDVVLEVWRRMGLGKTWWGKGFGFVWTLAWFVWISPAWIFPGLRGEKDTELLPYSFVRRKWA